MLAASLYGGLVEIFEVVEPPTDYRSLYPEDLATLSENTGAKYEIVRRGTYCPSDIPVVETTVHYGRWKVRLHHVAIFYRRRAFAARIRPPMGPIASGINKAIFEEVCEMLGKYEDFDALIDELNRLYKDDNIMFYKD